MRKWLSDALYDHYDIDLYGQDTRLAYVFVLYRGGERWVFSEEGLSKRFEDAQAYFHHFQYPFIHERDVHRAPDWVDRTVWYQIFPERFANGLGPKPYINAQWGDRPAPDSFFGGDLVGVARHLDYLQFLGVNGLYLTPVFRAPSNHKYDTLDYEEADGGFGGTQALRDLAQAAHRRGMRLMLDGVFNHCSWDHPFFQDVERRGRKSPYWSWFFIDGDRPDRAAVNYLTFGSVPYMPKFNTGHPEVIRYFCGVAERWMKACGVDGWRLDVMDELSAAFLRAFRETVKAQNPDALVIGELWHAPESYLRGDQLDGVMNYGLTKALADYLVTGALDAAGLRDRLCLLLTRCTAPSSRMMLNLLDCHDTHRFLTLLRGSVPRLKLALCLLFFFVGMPCVYYGDEIGMQGGYDPDCRRAFPWDEASWNRDLLAHVRWLAQLRTCGALAGDDIALAVSGDVFCLSRKRLRLLVNATEHPAAYAVPGAKGVLKPLSFHIDTQPEKERER